MATIQCPECYYNDGAHAPWCFRERAPDTQPMTEHVSGDCLCGRPRRGCEYHDPALQAPATNLREDLAIIAGVTDHFLLGDVVSVMTPSGRRTGRVTGKGRAFVEVTLLPESASQGARVRR